MAARPFGDRGRFGRRVSWEAAFFKLKRSAQVSDKLSFMIMRRTFQGFTDLCYPSFLSCP